MQHAANWLPNELSAWTRRLCRPDVSRSQALHVRCVSQEQCVQRQQSYSPAGASDLLQCGIGKIKVCLGFDWDSARSHLQFRSQDWRGSNFPIGGGWRDGWRGTNLWASGGGSWRRTAPIPSGCRTDSRQLWLASCRGLAAWTAVAIFVPGSICSCLDVILEIPAQGTCHALCNTSIAPYTWLHWQSYQIVRGRLVILKTVPCADAWSMTSSLHLL